MKILNSFKNHILHTYKNTFNYSGRASRKEYWLFALLHIIFIIIGTAILVYFPKSEIYIEKTLPTLYSILFLIPGLSLCVRRLHDYNSRGWWLLISLIPYIGVIILNISACTVGDEGPNRFGEKPNL